MLISKTIPSPGKTRSNTETLMSGCMLKHGSDSEISNAVYYWGEMMEIIPLEIKDEKEEYPWALWRLGIRSEGS